MIAVLLLLILQPGPVSAAWSVTFENSDPCGLKGSSVEFRCSYNYTDGETVTNTAWHKGGLKDKQWKRFKLSELPSYQNRSEYIGDQQHDCSLAIHDLQDNDTGYYYFRFDTGKYGRHSKESVYLSVTELISARVNPDRVRAGDTVTLECTTSCQLPSIVWFKDGRPLAKPEFQAQTEDAGNYACALKGQESVLSDPVALDVQYAPKKVTLSMSPSGDVVKGNLVTLTCSSDANPPVTQSGYRLYKDRQFISSGLNHTISDVQPGHSGLYHCQAWNNIGDFVNSTEVHLDVQYGPVNISVSMNPPHIVGGSSVNLTCNSAANPAADNYTWYKRTASPSSMVQVGSGQVMSIPSVEASHTGLYLCQARNLLGVDNSTEVQLTVDKTDINHLILLVGIGVKVIIVLLLTLAVIWAWRHKCSSAVDKEDNSPEYENISPAYMGQKDTVTQKEMTV